MKKYKWATPPDTREECHGCGYRRLIYITSYRYQTPEWACHYCIENLHSRPKDENGKCLAYTTEYVHNKTRKAIYVPTTAERIFIETGRNKKYKIKGAKA